MGVNTVMVNESSNIIEFGAGKILVTPAVNGDKIGFLIMEEGKGTGIIGELAPNTDSETTENDTVLRFSNIESLDVVLERLEELKRLMQNRDDRNE